LQNRWRLLPVLEILSTCRLPPTFHRNLSQLNHLHKTAPELASRHRKIMVNS
jgi:hypothetical protein